MERQPSRRRFLQKSLAAAMATAVVRAARHVVSVSPLEAESDLTSLEDRYTALEDFYVRNHHETPQKSARPLLRLEGEVGKPVRLTYADLTHLKKFEFGAVLECAGNPSSTNGLVSNGMWAGWSLSEIIQLARPLPEKYLPATDSKRFFYMGPPFFPPGREGVPPAIVIRHGRDARSPNFPARSPGRAGVSPRRKDETDSGA